MQDDRSARRRLQVVGVMGSGADPHPERSAAVANLLARLPVHLLTGGRGGVMAEVSRAFALVPGRSGLVIGVLPAGEDGQRLSPNPWVEVSIHTHLPLTGGRGTEAGSRNHVNVLSSDLVIALPGGAGTASEVALAQRYGRPVIAYVGSREDIPDLVPDVPMVDGIIELEARVRGVLAL